MIANMVKEITWRGKEKLICLIMVVQREELWFDVYIVMYLCYDINVVTHLEDFTFSTRLELFWGYQYLDLWLDGFMLVIKFVANFVSLN